MESSLIWGRSIYLEYDVYSWAYSIKGQVEYLEALCALPEEWLGQWPRRWCVREHAICFSKDLFAARFRKVTRTGFRYCEASVPFDCRALSVLGRFVQANLCCAYNSKETAWDRLLCKIPVLYKRVQTPQGFHFKTEMIFSYKMPALLEDTKSGMWVVAVLERVVHVVVELLYEVYDEY